MLKTILLVEDEKNTTSTVTLILKSAGYKVIAAENYEEVMKFLQESGKKKRNMTYHNRPAVFRKKRQDYSEFSMMFGPLCDCGWASAAMAIMQHETSMNDNAACDEHH